MYSVYNIHLMPVLCEQLTIKFCKPCTAEYHQEGCEWQRNVHLQGQINPDHPMLLKQPENTTRKWAKQLICKLCSKAWSGKHIYYMHCMYTYPVIPAWTYIVHSTITQLLKALHVKINVKFNNLCHSNRTCIQLRHAMI